MEKRHLIFELLTVLADMYRKDMSEGEFKVWGMVLDRYEHEEISQAFSLYLAQESRFPTPADIVSRINGDAEGKALDALIKVEKAMELHGSYRTVIFDDPIIHFVIDELGGWIKSCRVSEGEFTWWKKDFRERYKHHLKYQVNPLEVPPLIGIFDSHNLPKGSPAQIPVFIGNKDKCLEIMNQSKFFPSIQTSRVSLESALKR